MDNDLISREALKEQIKTEIANAPKPDTDTDYYVGVEQGLKLAKVIIDNAPTVDMNTEVSVAYLKGRRQGQSDERPQGEWGKWIITEIQCPTCFGYFETDCYTKEELKKCPKCGADMRKGGAEE